MTTHAEYLPQHLGDLYPLAGKSQKSMESSVQAHMGWQDHC